MWKRKLALAAVAASSIAWMPLPASAEVYIDVAPPPPRHEAVPHARHGYVWAPGYWRHDHGRYHWVAGHWVRERRGMYWHPDRYEQVDGRWVYRPGRWDRERWVENRYRDRDGDGVPNRADRAPNDPRYN